MTGAVKHVLVVEDNLATATVIRYSLEETGVEVTVAKCGQTAWNLLSGRDFDLVLADFLVPRVTGGELCKRMRDDPRLRHVPVIFLTAKGLELDEPYYRRELCVSAMIGKPFSPRELTRTVHECLGVGVGGG